MKEGWEIKKLEDLCNIELGKTPYRGDKSYWDLEKTTTNIWLSIADMLNAEGNVVSDSKEYISDKATKISKIVKKGTLLLSFKLTLGRLSFAGKDLYTNEAIAALSLKKNVEVDKYYLFHFLSYFDWNAAAEGDVKVKGKTLNKAKLKELKVIVPPLSEQKKIVSILDEALSAIATAKANAEQNLKNARELFESYLQGVFENRGDDWEDKMLNEIGKAQTGTTPKTAEKENYGDFIPFIKPADIDIAGDGEIRYDNDGLSPQGLSKGRKMKSGSILMVCIGATIGKVGFIDRDVSCNQQINALTVKKELDSKFVFYAMRTKKFYDQVIHNSAQATLPIINKGKWETLIISYPKSKIEQQKIVKKLDSVLIESKKLESIYQQKIEDLEELKKSVLKKAFSGELNTSKIPV